MPSFTSATPCSTFSRVTQFMRPRWSSGPKSPQFDPGGRCLQRCVMRALIEVPRDRLGDHHRLVAALALEDDLHRHLDATLDLLVFRKLEPTADARPGRHRSGKAHAIQTDVHAPP